jgi:hypothetical protein
VRELTQRGAILVFILHFSDLTASVTLVVSLALTSVCGKRVTHVPESGLPIRSAVIRRIRRWDYVLTVSPWLWSKIRLGSQPGRMSESLLLPAAPGRGSAESSGGLGSPRAGVTRCPRLGGGALSARHMKHVWAGVMADRMGRPPARRPPMRSFTLTN